MLEGFMGMIPGHQWDRRVIHKLNCCCTALLSERLNFLLLTAPSRTCTLRYEGVGCVSIGIKRNKWGHGVQVCWPLPLHTACIASSSCLRLVTCAFYKYLCYMQCWSFSVIYWWWLLNTPSNSVLLIIICDSIQKDEATAKILWFHKQILSYPFGNRSIVIPVYFLQTSPSDLALLHLLYHVWTCKQDNDPIEEGRRAASLSDPSNTRPQPDTIEGKLVFSIVVTWLPLMCKVQAQNQTKRCDLKLTSGSSQQLVSRQSMLKNDGYKKASNDQWWWKTNVCGTQILLADCHLKTELVSKLNP